MIWNRSNSHLYGRTGALALALATAACGSGGPGTVTPAPAPAPTPTPTSFSITATVTGLDAPGLVLQNGSSTIAVAANATSAAIASGVASGTLYAVTVQTQPAGVTCTVTNGSGTVTGNVTNISVACVHTVSGLKAPRFTETSVNLAAGTMRNPSDIVSIDFDGDGDLDLIVAQVAPPTYPATTSRLLAFRNDAGTFVDATAAVLGGAQMVNPRRFKVADFNKDGRSDLFVAETGTDTDPFPGGQSRIFIQTADGRLVDETNARLPLRNDYTHGADIADVNGDGTLDIFMANFILASSPRLYLGNSAGVFSDRTDLLPSSVAAGQAEAPAASLCDINGDRRPEVILGGNYYAPTGPSSFRPNAILMNDGSGRFAYDAAFTLPTKAAGDTSSTVDIVCADLNNDGSQDLVISSNTSTTPGLQLLLNDGTGHFRDATADLNLTFRPNEQWVVFIYVADINADGAPDLLLRMNASTYSPTVGTSSILLNRGNGTFFDASAQFTANTLSGLAVGDFNRDGVMDLVTIDVDKLHIFKGLAP